MLEGRGRKSGPGPVLSPGGPQVLPQATPGHEALLTDGGEGALPTGPAWDGPQLSHLVQPRSLQQVTELGACSGDPGQAVARVPKIPAR